LSPAVAAKNESGEEEVKRSEEREAKWVKQR
jgi:hypothetical protein